MEVSSLHATYYSCVTGLLLAEFPMRNLKKFVKVLAFLVEIDLLIYSPGLITLLSDVSLITCKK